MPASSPPPASPPMSWVAVGIFLTWLAPGAGHWLLGRRGKAVLYFTGITFLFVLGLILGQGRNFDLEHFWLHYLAQVWYGGLAVPGLLVAGHLPLEVAGDPEVVVMGFPRLDVGVLYTSVAGLLNVCVMVDVYETAYPRSAAGTQS